MFALRALTGGVRATAPLRANLTRTDQRNMATLQEMKLRLKTVNNMKKITASMKMVAAAKFRQMESVVKLTRANGAVLDSVDAHVRNKDKESEGDATNDTKVERALIVAISSDRGLCGGINSNVTKEVRRAIETYDAESVETKLFVVGDKGRLIFHKAAEANKLVQSISDYSKGAVTFNEALYVANEILTCGFDYDVVTIVSNKFKNALVYDTVQTHVFSGDMLSKQEDSVTDFEQEGQGDTLANLSVMHLANTLHSLMLDGQTAEQSARMNAMESATNNASDMIESLTLIYNRTRQAVITSELCEIISGAAALEG